MWLLTITHLHPYIFVWLRERRDLRISQHCHLPYNIKPLMDDVLCDVAPPNFCDVLLGKLYLWKWHVVYEYRSFFLIISLDSKLYTIPELAPPTSISLIFATKCNKVISETGKFVFFLLHSQSKGKFIATSMALGRVPPSSEKRWIRSWNKVEALWKPNCTCKKQGWDMEALHLLSSTKQNHSQEYISNPMDY